MALNSSDRKKNYSGVLLVVFHAIVNGRRFVLRILINCLFRSRQFCAFLEFLAVFFNPIFRRVFVTYFWSLTGFYAAILWICVPYLLLIIPHIINHVGASKWIPLRNDLNTNFGTDLDDASYVIGGIIKVCSIISVQVIFLHLLAKSAILCLHRVIISYIVMSSVLMSYHIII